MTGHAGRPESKSVGWGSRLVHIFLRLLIAPSFLFVAAVACQSNEDFAR
jgi:hypothetical protein